MTDVRIESGTLIASADERTVSGLLVPFGEEGRTNLGRFTVSPGVLTLPRDPQSVTLNLDHDREQPIARATVLAELEDGIHATFRFFDTDEADEALEEFRTGKRQKLSVEAKNMVLRAGKAVSGRIFGAAQLAAGAFPSATLLAADVGDIPGETAELEEPAISAPDENGDIAVTATETPATVTVTAEDSTTIFIPTPESEAPVGNAVVTDDTLNAGVAEVTLTKNDIIKQIASAKNSNDASLYAALSDVKVSGTGAVGTASIVPEWIGEVWSGKSFERRVTPLINQGTLTSLSQKGFRFVVKPQVAEWAGNKADVPSNSPTTEEVNFAITRFAGGWDIAREFIDFGQTDVIDSFLRLAADDYARKSDAKTLANLLAGATTATLASGGAANATAPRVTQALVRGALRVLAADGTPTFALVNPADYEVLLYTKELDTLGFLSQNIGLRDGQTAGFQVVAHTGITAGTVLVGDRAAASNFELAGAPIRVNALDIAKGGVDEALFGYMQTRIEYPQGLQLVTAINA